MLGRLFKEKNKNEKIEDMVRLLKASGKMTKGKGGVGGFGRDWYSHAYLFRGDGKKAMKEISYIKVNGKDKQIKGPWHNKRPAGPGYKFSNTSAAITYSAIPIYNTSYKWARIENNRLSNGYYSEGDLSFIKQMEGVGSFGKVGDQSPHRPGLYELYNRALKILSKSTLTDEEKELWQRRKNRYKDLMKLAQKDEFKRVYNYFVIKFDPKAFAVTLPKYMSRTEDFANDGVSFDPLYETDQIFTLLDGSLKKHIYELTMKSFKNLRMTVPDTGELSVDTADIYHLLASNDHELSNIARTVAITRAKPIDPILMQAYRLPKESYSKQAGIDIPDDYFKLDSSYNQYLISRPAELTDSNLEKDRTQAKVAFALKRLKDKDNVDNYISTRDENVSNDIAMKIRKRYWPETTFEEYVASLNRFKSSAIIIGFHVRNLLVEMKPEVFKDGKYMGMNIDKNVYDRLEIWYEHCVKMLLPEIIETTDNIAPQYEGISPPIKFHPSEAHKFKKAGARARNYDIGADGAVRRRRRAATPGRGNNRAPAVQAAVAAVEPEIIQQPQSPLDQVIASHNAGQTYEWDAMIQRMTIPIDMLNAIDNPSPREIYDIQRFPHLQGHMGNWAMIKEACVAWDNGQVLPGPDPRTDEFRNRVGWDWPNNEINYEPPDEGESIYSVFNTTNEIETEFSNTQAKIYQLGLNVIPGILAILYKTFVWTVANPVKTLATKGRDIQTVIPGCEWFKRITFSLVSKNEYVPVISPLAQSWLVPVEFSTADSSSWLKGNLYDAVGFSSDGYIKNGELISNGLQRRIQEQAVIWAEEQSYATQGKLETFSKSFQSDSLTEAINGFTKEGYLGDLISFLGEQVNSYKQTTRATTSTKIENFHNAISSRLQQGEAICYEAEIQMYTDMNWLIAAWGLMSIASLFVDRKQTTFRGVDAIDLIKVGLPTIGAVGNVLYQSWGAPASDHYPLYASNLEKALMLTAFVSVGQTVAAIVDDSVEEENEFNVQRYISDRNNWFDGWVWKKVKSVLKNPLRPFHTKTDEFIQTSRRFAGDPTSREMFTKNVPFRVGFNDTRRALIWFDVQNPGMRPNPQGLESKSRARNIHYPPGMVFRYGRDLHVIVDDLETMYKYDNAATDPKSVLMEDFGPYFENDEAPDSWADWAKVKLMQVGNVTRSILDVKKQFRIAYNVDKKEPVLLSVAGKNFAQSIRDTIVTSCAMTLTLMATSATDAMSSANAYRGIAVWASMENTMNVVPYATGMAVQGAMAPSDDLTQAIPLQFFAALSGAAVSQAVRRWILPRPVPVSKPEIYSLMAGKRGVREAFGLLIPLDLKKTILQNGRVVYGGKLWCPMTGRLFYFDNNTDRMDEAKLGRWAYHNKGAVKLFYDNQRGDNAEHMGNQIEDGFELTINGDTGGLMMTFKVVAGAGGGVMARYNHVNSPLATHLWFVKC